MQRILLVCVFAFSLFLKVSLVAGAEEAKVEPKAATQQTQTNDSDSELSSEQDSRITNKIYVNTQQPSVAPLPPANMEVGSVLAAKATDNSNTQKVALVPLIGGTGYNGNWYNHVKNYYSIGLAIDLPASEMMSIEVEGMFGKYNVSYAYYNHDFNQYSLGANAKFYLSRSLIQPYIGGGMAALYYDNMSYGPYYSHVRYDRWVGAGQGIAGLDVAVSRQLALGLRGAWVMPFINRPDSNGDGFHAYPYYEEASLMNNTFFRIMASARVSF